MEEVLINELVMEEILLIYSVCFMCGNFFFLFVRFVLLVMLISVLEELNKLINMKEKIIFVSLRLNDLVKFI